MQGSAGKQSEPLTLQDRQTDDDLLRGCRSFVSMPQAPPRVDPSSPHFPPLPTSAERPHLSRSALSDTGPFGVGEERREACELRRETSVSGDEGVAQE